MWTRIKSGFVQMQQRNRALGQSLVPFALIVQGNRVSPMGQRLRLMIPISGLSNEFSGIATLKSVKEKEHGCGYILQFVLSEKYNRESKDTPNQSAIPTLLCIMH